MAGTDLGTVVAHLRLDVNEFQSGLQQAQTQLNDATTGFERLTRTGQSLQKVGAGLTAAFTVPLTMIGKQAYEVHKTFTTAMSKVQALSGATGQELQQLTDLAREMGATTQFSATDAADALGYMALAGWNTKQSMAGLPGVLNLAAASGMDLAAASDLVTDYLSAFGEGADQAGRMADVLSYAQAHSNTTTEGLGEAFKNCAANAHAFGLDIEQTTALIGKLSDQGLKGSEAGTALTAVFRDITQKMKNGNITIGKTKIAVQDANGNYRNMTDILRDVESATNGMGDAQKNAALMNTFTSDSLKALNILLQTGSGNISEFEDALRGSGGAAEDMAKKMNDNLEGDLKTFNSALEECYHTIMDKLDPVFRKIVQGATKLLTAFSKLPQPVMIFIMALAGILAVLGPLLIMIGTFLTSIEKISAALEAFRAFREAGGFVRIFSTALGGVRGVCVRVASIITGTLIPAIQSLWAFMLANPITLVIAAIAALVAIFIYLWNHCEGFRNFWINLWNNIKSTVEKVAPSIKKAIEPIGKVVQLILKFFKTLTRGIGKLFNDLKNGDLKAFAKDFQQLGADLGKIVDNIFDNLEKAIDLGTQGLNELFRAGLNKMLDPVIDWGYSISGNMGDAMTDLYGIFSDSFRLITDALSDTTKFMLAIFRGDWKGALQIAELGFRHLARNIKHILRDIVLFIPELLNGLVDLINNGIDKLWDIIINWGYSVSGTVGDMMVDLYGLFSDGFNDIVTIIQDCCKLVYDIVHGDWDAAIQDMGKIFEDGVKTIGHIAGNISYLISDAFQGLDELFQHGLFNFSNPIIQWASGINKSLGNAFSDMFATISDGVSMITDFASDIFKILGNAFNGDWSGVVKGVQRLGIDLKDNFKIIFNDVKSMLINECKALGELITQGVQSACDGISNWFSQTGQDIQNWGADVANRASEIPGKIGDSLQNTGSQISNWGQNLYNQMSDAVQNSVNSVGDWFSQLPGKIQNGISGTGASISSWGQQTYNQVSSAAGDAVKAAGDWFDKLPDRIGYALGFAAGKIARWGVDIYNAVSASVPKAIDDTQKWFEELPGKIQTGLDKAQERFNNWGQQTQQKAQETGQKVANSVEKGIQELPGKIESAGTKASQSLQTWGQNMWNNVNLWGQNMWNSFTTWLNNTVQSVSAWGQNMWNQATLAGSQFLANTEKWFSQLPGRIWNWLNQTYNRAISWAGNMWNTAQRAGSQFLHGVLTWIQQLPGRVWSWLSNTINRAASFAQQFAQKGRQAAQQMANNVINGIRSLPGKVRTLGHQIVQGLWNGIQGAAGWLRNKIASFANNVIAGFKAGFGIHSPSTRMRDEIGKLLPPGLVVGVKLKTDSALKAVREFSDKVIAAAQLGDISAAMSIDTGDVNTQTIVQNNNLASAIDDLRRTIKQQNNDFDYNKLRDCFVEGAKTIDGTIVMDNTVVGKKVAEPVRSTNKLVLERLNRLEGV